MQIHSATGKRGLSLGVWRSIREPGVSEARVVGTHHLQLRHRATQGPFLAVHKRICRTERRNHHDGSPVSLGIPPEPPPSAMPTLLRARRPVAQPPHPLQRRRSHARPDTACAWRPWSRSSGQKERPAQGRRQRGAHGARGSSLLPRSSAESLTAPLPEAHGVRGAPGSSPLWGHGTRTPAPKAPSGVPRALRSRCSTSGLYAVRIRS